MQKTSIKYTFSKKFLFGLQEIGKTKRTWFNPIRMIGEQQSRFSSIFNYPLNWTKPAPSSSSFVHGFQLFITVDGVTFSDGSTIYIHDSTCQVYAKNNGNIIFSLRVSALAILP